MNRQLLTERRREYKGTINLIRKVMESQASLLLSEKNENKGLFRTRFDGETKRLASIALPMMVVTVSQYLLRISPLFMLGHLGELQLSSASVATSLANVTGYSIIYGMAGALETLCGQAYGAEQFQRVGTFTYGAIICLILVSIPVLILWIYTDKLLIFMGQDHLMSIEAGKYAVWLIPSLFPYAVYQSLVRYLQVQSLILPMLISTLATLCFHLSLCWAFIFKLKLGNAGAALSIGVSYWLNVIFLGVYVKYSSSCKKTHASFSREVIKIMRVFQVGYPSFTYGLLGMVVIRAGDIAFRPVTKSAARDVCIVDMVHFSVISLHYHIPDAFGAAASTRISNELGAGKPRAARTAFIAVVVLSVAECIMASLVVLGCRRLLGYSFSDEGEVVEYVNKIAPLLSLCVIMDGFEAVLSGIARGSGWQHIGVYVNLVAYYLIGIPVALVLGFIYNLKAAPMVVVTVSQILLRLVSMMMVGHLGELPLSLSNVTGLTILLGMASALETLCGQAFGAKQYEKLGIYTYASVICLLLVCLPISLLWTFMDKLLILMGQDLSISAEAGKYATWLIPALFPYAILQSLTRYLQAQSLIFPMLWTSVVALIFHVPICWSLVFKMKLGIAGAALSIGLSNWLNVILLLLYISYSSACKKTNHSLTANEVLTSMRKFFCIAVPSTVMVCLEWWSSETVVLLSGLLPNPQLETSVLSICTRVSNELGAGCADSTRTSAWAATLLSLTEAVIACSVLICCRSFLGHTFSTETEVVQYFGNMTPFVCLLLATDDIQAVISGVAKGSGWQHLGAYVNLGAFYLVGMPVSVVLGFVFHLRGKGSMAWT